ncbi:MAG: tyrosine-type recombinase/integrase [Sneathiella sp.]
MPRLSKRTLDALKIEDKEYFVWDDDLPGFGVRVMPTGRKSFLIQYRDSGRRTRRKSLGRFGTVTAEEAKREARDLLSSVTRGANPSEDRLHKRNAPTVSELCDRFMSEYVPIHCKETTAKEYLRAVDLFIKPAIGLVKVEDVTRPHIAELHHKHNDIPYQANRTLGVISVMFNQAEVWGYRPDNTNPRRHVKKYEEKPRERFLSKEEFARLGKTLKDLETSGTGSQAAINAFWLFLLTGCRLSEIQTLKWEYIQENNAFLPDSKTGAKKVRLSNHALNVLSRVERIPGNPYVITGKLPGAFLTDLQKPWRRIRKVAGLDDVRIHDLRHSFASSAVGIGEPVERIGNIVGHKDIRSTMRYAHHADGPVHATVDRISDEIWNDLNS